MLSIAVAPADCFGHSTLSCGPLFRVVDSVGVPLWRLPAACFLAIGGAMMHPTASLASPVLQMHPGRSLYLLARSALRGSALHRLSLRSRRLCPVVCGVCIFFRR